MNNVNFFSEYFNLSDEQNEKYHIYFKLLNEHNQKMNLTGIDDEFGVYLKHFYDSLLIFNEIKKSGVKIGDLGSGAGFPGLVLAIFFNENEFYLIEPTKKRCDFLQVVVNELKLTNVFIINKRAEELEKEQYDIVVSRAVASLNILLELAIPLIKKDGILIAQKGRLAEEEIKGSKNALKILKSSIEEIKKEILPFEESLRYNIIVKKNDFTPSKYPRNYGQIKKKPL